jgi:hypothetical protein
VVDIFRVYGSPAGVVRAAVTSVASIFPAGARPEAA